MNLDDFKSQMLTNKNAAVPQEVIDGVITVLSESPDAAPPVESKGFGLISLLLERALSFVMIGAIAFLLLVSLGFSALLGVIGDRLMGVSLAQSIWANVINIAVSLLLTSMIYGRLV